jgi:hypothetical protein
MYLAAALAAHNVLAPRQGPVPGPSLPLVSEDAIATALDGSAIDSDDEIPTPCTLRAFFILLTIR